MQPEQGRFSFYNSEPILRKGFSRWIQKGIDTPKPTKQEIEELDPLWEHDLDTLKHLFIYLRDIKEFEKEFV